MARNGFLPSVLCASAELQELIFIKSADLCLARARGGRGDPTGIAKLLPKGTDSYLSTRRSDLAVAKVVLGCFHNRAGGLRRRTDQTTTPLYVLVSS